MLSNAITVFSLYESNHLFEVYPFDRNYAIKAKRKDLQRFESSLQILQTFMAPAMHSLYAQKYFQRSVQKSAENFAMEAIENVLLEVQFNFNMDVLAKLNLLTKLKNMKVIASFSRFVLREHEIEEFYDEINFNDSEELLQTYIGIILYNRKIPNEPSFSWKKTQGNSRFQHSSQVPLIIKYFVWDRSTSFMDIFIKSFCFQTFHPCSLLSVFPSFTNEIFQHS